MPRICPTCGQEIDQTPLETLLAHCAKQVIQLENKISDAQNPRTKRGFTKSCEKWREWKQAVEQALLSDVPLTEEVSQ